MILKWHFYDVNSAGEIYLNEENVSEYLHRHARAQFGVFEVSVEPCRLYKDGTRQWLVLFYCPEASSKELITLTKPRGYLADAIKAAEDFIFYCKVYPNEN